MDRVGDRDLARDGVGADTLHVAAQEQQRDHEGRGDQDHEGETEQLQHGAPPRLYDPARRAL